MMVVIRYITKVLVWILTVLVIIGSIGKPQNLAGTHSNSRGLTAAWCLTETVPCSPGGTAVLWWLYVDHKKAHDSGTLSAFGKQVESDNLKALMVYAIVATVFTVRLTVKTTLDLVLDLHVKEFSVLNLVADWPAPDEPCRWSCWSWCSSWGNGWHSPSHCSTWRAKCSFTSPCWCCSLSGPSCGSCCSGCTGSPSCSSWGLLVSTHTNTGTCLLCHSTLKVQYIQFGFSWGDCTFRCSQELIQLF